MKIVAIFLALMIAVAFVYGFDFSIYKQSDLTTYPDLDFHSVVPQFTSASELGINGLFVMLSGVVDSASFIIDQFTGGDEVLSDESANQRYTLLVKYKEYLSLWDRLRLSLAFVSFNSVGEINALYEKYAFFIEAMENQG